MTIRPWGSVGTWHAVGHGPQELGTGAAAPPTGPPRRWPAVLLGVGFGLVAVLCAAALAAGAVG